jgi:hypothetical protein
MPQKYNNNPILSLIFFTLDMSCGSINERCINEGWIKEVEPKDIQTRIPFTFINYVNLISTVGQNIYNSRKYEGLIE